MAGQPVPRDGVSDDPWTDWYDAYRRQTSRREAAEAALEAGLKRQIGWMSWFIVAWTAVICAATVFVIWLLLW